jgi:hypothetical protein
MGSILIVQGVAGSHEVKPVTRGYVQLLSRLGLGAIEIPWPTYLEVRQLVGGGASVFSRLIQLTTEC